MRKTIIIFGGSGFIGSHIVRRLSKFGYRIIIPVSNYIKAQKLKIYGDVGQILIIKLNSINKKELEKIISHSDYVINLKTIWIEKNHKTFKNQIYDLNKLIVNTIQNNKKIKKYIFFSGLGVSEKSLSTRSRVIAKSEKYIQNNLNSYSIIRPSIVIGFEDKFITKLLIFFKLFFFIPLFGKGNARFQPTYVDDVALAVQKLILKNNVDGNIYELGGSNIFSYKEFYHLIIKEMNIKRIIIPISFFIAKIGIFIFEKLSIELINREQLMLFQNDNLVGNKFLKYSDLKIKPLDIFQVIKKII